MGVSRLLIGKLSQMSAQDDVGFKGQRQWKIQNPKQNGLMGISPKWSFSGKHVGNALKQNGGFAASDWKVVKQVCTILWGIQVTNLTYSCVVESSKHFEKRRFAAYRCPRLWKRLAEGGPEQCRFLFQWGASRKQRSKCFEAKLGIRGFWLEGVSKIVCIRLSCFQSSQANIIFCSCPVGRLMLGFLKPF